MKILFLHGWTSVVGGRKPTFLIEQGHEVLNPALPDEDFDESVRIAEAEYNEHNPDVIVGSSRGGAVAMNMNSGDTPLVLMCPAWRKWGAATTTKINTTILHSRADDVVPFAHSEELLANSRLPSSALVEVGNDHRLADPEPMEAMLRACEQPSVFRAKSIADFLSIFKPYMRNRVCGIVFAESKGNKQPHFEIGSGFVIEAEGIYVLVSAGHVFKQIAELAKNEKLIGVSLIVPSGPKSVAEISLYEEDLATAKFSESMEFDVAFMCISPDLIKHLNTAGLLAINRQFDGPSHAKRAKRVLVGYGADGAHLNDEEMFVTVENNTVRPRYRTGLGAVPFKMIGLSNSSTDDGINYNAIPEADDTPTLIGLSGGIVLDVFMNEPIRNYAWVGVQSTQHTITKQDREVVTKVQFTSAIAIAEEADRFARDFLDELQGFQDGES
ncbi:alpha/beta fold hydrolase [Rosistilla oblonga]|uniref:alpha/beta fold hydrolase n=1 Tax=Rosistilla oblonga TaxID=2527990 RepID=UPI003A9762B9